MAIKSYEVRSEEEGVGNLLLVVSDEPYVSDEQALKLLWVEAQEYNEKTPMEVIEGDYEKEREKFGLEKLVHEALKEKLKELFRVMESFDGQFEEAPEKSLLCIKEHFSENLTENSKVFLLEDDFSTYSIFMVNEFSKYLFSWCDVV